MVGTNPTERPVFRCSERPRAHLARAVNDFSFQFVLRSGKGARAHVADITLKGIFHRGAKILVYLDEPRLLAQPEHVVQ